MDKNLKRKLMMLQVPPYDKKGLEETLFKARQIRLHPERLRMTNTEFALDQLRFIKKKTWFLKLVFTGLILGMTIHGEIDMDGWIWSMLAISGPVLCLINVSELCNVFQPGMLELQMTAKNSLEKVLMVRLLVFGIWDLIFLVCTALTMAFWHQAAWWQVLMNGTLPYNIMCLGCMEILNRASEENTRLYCAALGACLSCMILILKITDFERYGEHMFMILVLAEAASVIGVAGGFRKILRRAGGMINEVNNRAAV